MATGIVGFHVSVVKHDLQEQEKKKAENGKVYIGHIRRKSEES